MNELKGLLSYMQDQLAYCKTASEHHEDRKQRPMFRARCGAYVDCIVKLKELIGEY